jgi:hypothetical protein
MLLPLEGEVLAQLDDRPMETNMSINFIHLYQFAFSNSASASA